MQDDVFSLGTGARASPGGLWPVEMSTSGSPQSVSMKQEHDTDDTFGMLRSSAQWSQAESGAFLAAVQQHSITRPPLTPKQVSVLCAAIPTRSEAEIIAHANKHLNLANSSAYVNSFLAHTSSVAGRASPSSFLASPSGDTSTGTTSWPRDDDDSNPAPAKKAQLTQLSSDETQQLLATNDVILGQMRRNLSMRNPTANGPLMKRYAENIARLEARFAQEPASARMPSLPMRSFVQRCAKRLFARQGQRSLQEAADVYLVHLLASFRKLHRHHWRDEESRVSFDLEHAFEEHSGSCEGMSHAQRLREIDTLLDEQAISMLRAAAAMEDGKGMDPYPTPLSMQAIPGESPSATRDRIRAEQEIEERRVELGRPPARDLSIVQKRIPHPDGFELTIERSSVEHEGAGFGVWVRGLVAPGTLLAFYPGVVYAPQQLTADIVQDNDYLIARYDGAVLDSRAWHTAAIRSRTMEELLALAGVGELGAVNPDRLRYRNGFAIGGFVNHPPLRGAPGPDTVAEEANVIQFAFNWPFKQWADFAPFIPNAHFKRRIVDVYPEDEIKGVALVAKRELCDEELFMNYRFNPNNAYPSWYGQPNLEEAQRRWSKVTIL